MSTRTYVLEGKQYTVPADTTMEELDQYIQGQNTPAPDLKTGAGMEAYSQKQAQKTITGTGQEGFYNAQGKKISGPNREPLSFTEQDAQARADRETKFNAAMQRAANAPTPFSSASAALLPQAALGARGALPFLAKTTLATAGGSSLGGYSGGEIAGGLGRIFSGGDPKREAEWAAAGRQYGSLIGAAAGMYVGARGGTVPGKGTMLERIFGGGEPKPEVFPVSKSPGPYRGPSSVPKPTPEVDPVAAAVKNRTASWIPTKMPSAAEPVAPETPSGEGPAPSTGKLYKLPVPREPLPGENPAYMASTKRNRLLNLGRQARPGAGDQLRNIGNTVLYTPETGYAPPKEKIDLPFLPKGNATPFQQAEPQAIAQKYGLVYDGTKEGIHHFRDPQVGGGVSYLEGKFNEESFANQVAQHRAIQRESLDPLLQQKAIQARKDFE